MDKNKANVPKIRFPGFTDPWEQRKLGELSESFEYGLNAAAMDFDGENKYIRITDIDDSSRSFLDTDLTSPNIDLSNADNFKLKYGDILFARTGGSVGKSYIYRDFDGLVYYAGFLIRARIKKGFDPEFVFYSTLTNEYSQFIRITSQRSGQPGVNAQEYAEYEIKVPNYEEQVKIGGFMRQLDNLITLHQRKLSHLQDKKKSLLQKMFPQNGENFPELRFPGFTDPWEQRKLKQLANFAKGQGYSKNDLTDVGTPIILYGRLYTKYQSTISEVDTFAIPQSGSVYSTGEEVIVPASGETAEDIARASAIVKSGFLLGGDLNIIYPNKDISTIFLALLISNGKQQKELSKKAQGKSVVHLHNSDLEDVIISYPCREEQEKIGSVFANLDNLITLHQRKLNHLQEQKKALLQQMFV